MGHLIPAGSGLPAYRRVKIQILTDDSEEVHLIDDSENEEEHEEEHEMATVAGD